ncbi:MAG TPA: alpha/beta fold hydrolase [Acidimicrobiales bacterium]|nr:alpha/beta fold hydrolase [Acidimicrobiales bacterium]
MLHAETSGSGRRLVLAHGFTQTARSWGRFADLLGGGRELVRVDLPGHGGSAGIHADLAESAELLSEIASSGGAPFDLLGYSLGARISLHAALGAPAGLGRLVLIGGTGGIEDAALRADRRARDEALAASVEEDLDGFLERWVAAPMFAGLRDPGLAERRRNTAAGLASSLRLAGTGNQDPLWDRLGALGAPLLALAGADDVRFAHHAARLARGAPIGVFSLVPGAGHAAHLAQPELTAAIVRRFLDCRDTARAAR